MLLLVGLGNPGAQHAGQRHNIGFMAIDALAAALGAGPFKAKFHGQIAEARAGDARLLLLKPQTFMNLSGQSAAEAARFHKIPNDQVIVFHDELDLPPGKVRVKRGGGAAGHNGLRSIKSHLHSDEFLRVRIGVDKPVSKERGADHVLNRFGKRERAEVDVTIARAADAVEAIAADGVDQAMNTFN